MRFGRRDHESYIGSYDPEHEMPDPARHPHDRWQSEAYRHNAHDSRFAYRWDADRFEDRLGAQRGNEGSGGHEHIQPRDRYESMRRPELDHRCDRRNDSHVREDSRNGRDGNGGNGGDRESYRSDGERYPSDFGWSQSGRRWEHGHDFDERGGRWRW